MFRTRQGRIVPFGLAICGIGVGVGFGYLASLSGETWKTVILLSFAAASGGVGVYGLLGNLIEGKAQTAAGRARADADFYEAAPEPIALLDRGGRILALNAAARAVARRNGAAAPRRIGDLSRGLKDAPAQIYRLMTQAFRGESVRAVLSDADGRDIEISVWPLGEGRAAWRWREIETPPSEVKTDGSDRALAQMAGLGWLRIGADGDLLASNAVFDRWLEGAPGPRSFHSLFPDAARRIVHRGPQGDRALCRTRLSGGPDAPRTVSLLYAPGLDAGEAVLVAAPAPVSESANIAPLGAADKLLGAFDALQSVRLFEDAPIGVMLLSDEGRVLRLNAAADRLLAGAAPANFEERLDRVMSGALGDRLVDWISASDREAARAQIGAAGEGLASSGVSFEAQFGREGDEGGRIAQCYLSQVDVSNGRMLLCYLIDASEQHGLQQRFLQSQKFNAIGELAGGVAHDFNNLLTVILGSSEQLLRRLTAEEAAFAELSAVYQSAHRAAELVKKLLAFSRQQTLRPQIVNVTDRLSEFSYILKRMIAVEINLRQELDEGLWPVLIDVNALEQAVMNLVVNASHAVSEGGVITLSAANEVTNAPRPGRDFSMPPGEYVRIRVEDNGSGMTEEVLSKIFVPYFTTKSVDKGTGLGLAAVYGFVKQSQGYIFVDSEIGRGTTFEIFLPRSRADFSEPAAEEPAARAPVAASPEIAAAVAAADFAKRVRLEDAPPIRLDDAFKTTVAPAPPAASAESRMGQNFVTAQPVSVPKPAPPIAAPRAARQEDASVVLLVEDETSLRSMVARFLESQGYEVIEAECGEGALEALAQLDRRIDLMVSDVVMPNLDGPSLLRRLGERRPDLKTIFMTGYARDHFAETLESSAAVKRAFHFLQKPFQLETLRKLVADTLAEDMPSKS